MSEVTSPNEWLRARLGSIIELKYGRSLPEKTRDNGKHPVFGSNGIVGRHSQPLVNKEGIIVGRKGSHGAVQLSESPFFPIDTTYYVDEFFGQPLKYWFYQLRNLPLTELNRSTAIPGLNRDDAYSQIVSLPSIAEQEVIADKLDTLLALVEKTKVRLERIPAILKRFRQSVLTAAVSGQMTEDKHQLGVTKPFKLDSEMWEIPSDWKQLPLNELIDGRKPICYGVVQPGDEAIDGKRLIRVCDINDGEIDYSNLRTISEEIDRKYSRSKVSEGDVLVTIVGVIGRIGIVRGSIDANIARAVAKLSPNMKLIHPMYLHIWLSSPSLQSWLVNSSKEVARKTLNLKELKETPVALPSLEEQTEILHRVEDLFAFAESIEKKANAALKRINNLTQSILVKAFRGDLTAGWRAANPDLISGENSSEALIKKIKTERNTLKNQPKLKSTSVKIKTGGSMSKQIINVVEALEQAGKPLSGQQLLAAAGYPSDSSIEELERFFLDIREALVRDKAIEKLKRSDDGQDWFSLVETSSQS
jgi:type I restriction enzyme S subunit